MGILDKSGMVDYIEDRRFVMMKVFVVSIMLAGMVSCLSPDEGEARGIEAVEVMTSTDAAEYCSYERSLADPITFRGSMHCNTLIDRTMICDPSDWCFCQSASVGMTVNNPDLAMPAWEHVCWMCDRHGNLFDFWFINQTRGITCDEGNL